MTDTENRISEEKFEKLSSKVTHVRYEISKVVVGMDHLVECLLIGVICGGHVLVEGAPGLAKTLTIRTLSRVLGVRFSRIQFTPDLLPGDLIGTLVYDQKTGEFTPHLGPIFSNMVLADEINRSPAKVQSALLEAMEEKQVTIGRKSYVLEQPFLVLATQNPVEQEGTYPLPEAQLDRFMFKVLIDYLNVEQEIEVLQRMSAVSSNLSVDEVLQVEEILEMRAAIDQVEFHHDLQKYIVSLVDATRRPEKYGLEDLQSIIRFGASPRASLSMVRAAKAIAFMDNRKQAESEDIRQVCNDVMRHRLVLTYRAEADGITADDIINQITSKVPLFT